VEDAAVLAESVFGTTYGKTANGLVRYSKRFRIKSVIDSTQAGKDAGSVLFNRTANIPIVSSVKESIAIGAKTLIVGIATDGGVLPEKYRPFIIQALNNSLDIVSGLHEFISDDPEFSKLASSTGSKITDVRKMFRDRKDLFTGRILDVTSKKIAVLGTDSAVGKRTTAVFLSDTMERRGINSVMIGTGQTSWMQGFKYTIVLDAIVNDFVSGALETVALQAWDELHPEFMFLEGQGSVIHPAYPGSYEIIGALHPDAIILQHAPKRLFYDGFDRFRIPPLEKYIKILELMSDKKVIAISVNKENMTSQELQSYIEDTQKKFGIPVFDPLGNLSEIAGYVKDTVNGP